MVKLIKRWSRFYAWFWYEAKEKAKKKPEQTAEDCVSLETTRSRPEVVRTLSTPRTVTQSLENELNFMGQHNIRLVISLHCFYL